MAAVKKVYCYLTRTGEYSVRLALLSKATHNEALINLHITRNDNRTNQALSVNAHNVLRGGLY